MVLAAGAVGAGWIGMPFGDINLLHHWLEPVFEPVNTIARDGAEHAGHAAEMFLMGVSIVLALGGIYVARYVYLKLRADQRPTGGLLYPVLYNKWYVDEIYDLVFVRGLSLGGGAACARFDSGVVDGGVNGTAWATRFVSTVSMWWDTWIVDGLVNLGAFTVRALSFPVRFLQTGFLQSYALVFVLGLILIFGYYWVR